MSIGLGDKTQYPGLQHNRLSAASTDPPGIAPLHASEASAMLNSLVKYYAYNRDYESAATCERLRVVAQDLAARQANVAPAVCTLGPKASAPKSPACMHRLIQVTFGFPAQCTECGASVGNTISTVTEGGERRIEVRVPSIWAAAADA